MNENNTEKNKNKNKKKYKKFSMLRESVRQNKNKKLRKEKHMEQFLNFLNYLTSVECNLI